MSYINIGLNDCISTSRVFINNNSTNFDTRILSLNSTGNNLSSRTTSLSTQFVGPGAILQTKFVRVNETRRIPAFSPAPGGFANDIELYVPTLGIAPINQNSKILIQIHGGRYHSIATYGQRTFLYGRLNGTGSFNDLFGRPAEIIYHTTGNTSAYIQGQHDIRAIYTPPPGSTLVEIQPRVTRYAPGIANPSDLEDWNALSTKAPGTATDPIVVPIIFSLSEIQ